MRSRTAALALTIAAAVLASCSSGSTAAGSASLVASSSAASSSTVSISATTGSAISSSSSTGIDGSGDFAPTADNPDPSTAIADIYVGDPALYAQRYHIAAPARVAYDRYPPVGGPHDPVWAACDGVVYAVAVRNENMVHSLEHGAVWIAYNPDTISADDLSYLTGLVPTVPYLVMTPYPGLDAPVSLQAWAHQLKLNSARDVRLAQFIVALLRNPYTTPEPGATCSQPSFDVAKPPAFDPTPPGPDAVPLDYAPPSTTG